MSDKALRALSYLKIGRLTAVYAVFCERADRYGIASPSQQEVADRSGLPLRTVQRHIARLRRTGRLVDMGTRVGNQGRTPAYRVHTERE